MVGKMSGSWFRGFVLAEVALLALLAGSGDVRAADESDRTNVVVILADDLGYSDLGCYGGEIQTPVLDELARQGVQFTQFYNTARCWPTRAALLTGYYPQQIRRDKLEGIPSGNGGQRPAWAQLLPARLKAKGYRAYHSGKWHLDGSPQAGGFDRAYSLDDHDRFFGPKNHSEDGKKLPVPAADEDYYATSAIAEHAIRCLREHRERAGDRPFFSYIAFTAPHFPLQAPQADIERCRPRYKAGWDRLREERWASMQKLGLPSVGLSPMDRNQGPTYPQADTLAKLGPAERERAEPWGELPESVQAFQAEKMAIHAAMIERMDAEIGRIVAELKAMGEFERTLFVFLSDNGASAEMMVRGDGHNREVPAGSAGTFLCLGPGWSSLANTPFHKHKTWVHEGGISTPFIVHWPAGLAGARGLRAVPGHVIDVVPTVLEVAGVDVEGLGGTGSDAAGEPELAAPGLPGQSLLPVLRGEAQQLHPWLWWQHEGNRAYREGDWKIVAAGEQSAWELYDLSQDRTELRNLAEAQPERVRQLEEAWNQQLARFRVDATRDLPPGENK